MVQFKMMNIPPHYPHFMNSLFTQFKIMIQFIYVKVKLKIEKSLTIDSKISSKKNH